MAKEKTQEELMALPLTPTNMNRWVWQVPDFAGKWPDSYERIRFGRAVLISAVSILVLAVASGVARFLYLSWTAEYRTCDPGPDCINTAGVAVRSILVISGSVLLTLSIIGAIGLGRYRLVLVRESFFRWQSSVQQERVREADNQVFGTLNHHTSSGEVTLDLSSLWNATQERLSLYHTIATRQADTSFRRAQAAMISGFVLLMATIAASLVPHGTVGSVITGLLGASSAALGGYLGKTFLRSQENAASRLQAYFLQPLEFSRYLVAERLLNTLSAECKSKGVLDLVAGLSSTARQTPPKG